MARKLRKPLKTAYPPSKPHEPPKTITKYETVEKIHLPTWGPQDFKMPEGADSVEVEVSYEYYGESVDGVTLIFSNKKTVPNPNYKTQYDYYLKQLERYEKDYAKYKEDVKSYDEKLKAWKAQEKELKKAASLKEKEQRRQAYEKLKQEFDPPPA